MSAGRTISESQNPGSPVGMLEASPPGEVFRSHLELRRLPSVILLCLLTAVLLLISFPPFDCWYVGYFALVPWGLAMFGGIRCKWTLAAGWLTGLAFWAGSVYWLVYPTAVGYIATVVYLSVYWLMASGLIRSSMRRGYPMWLVLPIIWVGIEFVRSWAICFPWFFLSQTQYSCLELIQISDITGQYGVSFFVAMVNGIIIDVLYCPLFTVSARGSGINRNIVLGFCVVLLAGAGMLIYGMWRVGQKTTTSGPVVGVVQEAIPITLTGEGIPADEMLGMHLRGSLKFTGENCDVVIWPETMLPGGLNTEILNLDVASLDDDHIRSIAANLWGLETVRENAPEKLRFYLDKTVGHRGADKNHTLAAIELLCGYVTPGQLEAMDGSAVRLLAGILLGEENTQGVGDSVLRGWLRLFIYNADVSALSDENICSVYGMLTEQPAVEIVSLPREQKIVAVRATVAAMSKTKTLNVQRTMVELCSLIIGCPIIAGGSTIHRNASPASRRDLWELRNSVMMFEFRRRDTPVYAKMYLVPFSEYVPLKYSCPKIHKLLRWFVPEVMPQLRGGEQYVRFEIRRGRNRWELITPVCFEGSVARLCRRMVNSAPKGSLVMANLSNDGWFVREIGNGRFAGTTEQAQHLCHYVFRAVENRIPVVRSVNTGISAMIDSDGKIKSVLELKVGEYRKQTMVTGVMKVNVFVDSRRSVYSRIGDVFAVVVLSAAFGVVCCFFRKKTNE